MIVVTQPATYFGEFFDYKGEGNTCQILGVVQINRRPYIILDKYADEDIWPGETPEAFKGHQSLRGMFSQNASPTRGIPEPLRRDCIAMTVAEFHANAQHLAQIPASYSRASHLHFISPRQLESVKSTKPLIQLGRYAGDFGLVVGFFICGQQLAFAARVDRVNCYHVPVELERQMKFFKRHGLE
ncbi:MAG TPA: hypothetical protein VHB73_03770 [Alphaproteobacteria bacterium]|nr:hypothetical protein [Alphaproteobacteria bacterium]